MQFFKSLFGFGGGSGRGLTAQPSGDSDGLYVFVQPKNCAEIVRVRINLRNDLSQTDDGNGFIVHKLARGQKCTQNVDMTLHFDSQRRIVEREIDGGQFVDDAAYTAWVESQTPAS
ncbi:MAG TPA: hypothetical protein VER79_13510 [Candidatus Limnocylindrales bacterium]|nr:hypothetical protein [Candidatus Limnocylindrales bacterium]